MATIFLLSFLAVSCLSASLDGRNGPYASGLEPTCPLACDHVCRDGACVCFVGYHLSKNKRSCIDRDECLEGIDRCAHYCLNTEGSYKCACRSGYTLTGDGFTCTLDEICDGPHCGLSSASKDCKGPSCAHKAVPTTSEPSLDPERRAQVSECWHTVSCGRDPLQFLTVFSPLSTSVTDKLQDLNRRAMTAQGGEASWEYHVSGVPREVREFHGFSERRKGSRFQEIAGRKNGDSAMCIPVAFRGAALECVGDPCPKVLYETADCAGQLLSDATVTCIQLTGNHGVSPAAPSCLLLEGSSYPVGIRTMALCFYPKGRRDLQVCDEPFHAVDIRINVLKDEDGQPGGVRPATVITNPCEGDAHGCEQDCLPEGGSFTCACLSGYRLKEDRKTCEQVGCPVCLHGGECVNATCRCPAGFTGRACESDINECAAKVDVCDQMCRNTFGSYVCLCGPGYRSEPNGVCKAVPCSGPWCWRRFRCPPWIPYPTCSID